MRLTVCVSVCVFVCVVVTAGWVTVFTDVTVEAAQAVVLVFLVLARRTSPIGSACDATRHARKTSKAEKRIFARMYVESRSTAM